MISRRGFIRATGALLAAPAIVRVASLMPVRSPIPGEGDFVWHWLPSWGGKERWHAASLHESDRIVRDHLGRLMLGRAEIVPAINEVDEFGMIRRPGHVGFRRA